MILRQVEVGEELPVAVFLRGLIVPVFFEDGAQLAKDGVCAPPVGIIGGRNSVIFMCRPIVAVRGTSSMPSTPWRRLLTVMGTRHRDGLLRIAGGRGRFVAWALRELLGYLSRGLLCPRNQCDQKNAEGCAYDFPRKPDHIPHRFLYCTTLCAMGVAPTAWSTPVVDLWETCRRYDT